jgi:gliding motility-associated protein GldM
MSLPKEPRQKMINIMYLVLTALLALNVSSEILNAFKTIDKSFSESNKGLAARSQKRISDFDQPSIIKDFGPKVAIWKPKAEKINEVSEALYKEIETLKSELKKESGQKEPNGPFKEDDLEAATRLFLNGKVGQTKGDQLFANLSKFKEELVKIEPTFKVIIKNLPDLANVPDGHDPKDAAYKAMTPAQKWATVYFHMTPTVAAVAILSKFQNDIRNSQAQLIDECFSRISQVPLPPPSLSAFASTNSSMLMTGDELVITAGLSAFQNETKPNVSIDGVGVSETNGEYIYKTTASTPGEYTKRVSITYKDPSTGETKNSTKDVTYKVGVPAGLAVSTDSTRVFYIGAPGGNQLSVSGATGGAGAIKINVVAGAATVNQAGPGSYKVITTAEGPVTLSVTDGKVTSKVTIPSKKLPPPTIVELGGTIGFGKPFGGTIGAAEFKLQTKLSVSLPGFILNGVQYTVSSFKMTFSGGRGFSVPVTITVLGPSLKDPKTQEYLTRCGPGTYVEISDIVALDAAKTEQRMKNTLQFNLK